MGHTQTKVDLVLTGRLNGGWAPDGMVRQWVFYGSPAVGGKMSTLSQQKNQIGAGPQTEKVVFNSSTAMGEQNVNSN